MCPTEASTPSGATEIDGEAPVRLALLDDHGLIVDSLATWFSDHAPDFAVVVRATTLDGPDPEPRVPRRPRAHGPAARRQRLDRVPDPGVPCSRGEGASSSARSTTTPPASDASRAGAAAFVSKTLPADELVDLARRVARGERLRRRSAVAGDATDAAAHADDDGGSARLSAAEERALRLYAQGYSTLEVAHRMDVGYETAKTYLRRVREKYARAGRPASRKSELIRRAAEDGFLE